MLVAVRAPVTHMCGRPLGAEVFFFYSVLGCGDGAAARASVAGSRVRGFFWGRSKREGKEGESAGH